MLCEIGRMGVRLPLIRWRPRTPRREVVGGVDYVRYHGARGRHHAGTPPVEHQFADGVTVDEDSVERIVDRRQRVALPE